jgi:hypothetical protein
VRRWRGSGFEGFDEERKRAREYVQMLVYKKFLTEVTVVANLEGVTAKEETV